MDRQALQAEIEQLKQPDALSAAVAEFGKDFPSIVRPLVTERDQYMVRGAGWQSTAEEPLMSGWQVVLREPGRVLADGGRAGGEPG